LIGLVSSCADASPTSPRTHPIDPALFDFSNISGLINHFRFHLPPESLTEAQVIQIIKTHQGSLTLKKFEKTEQRRVGNGDDSAFFAVLSRTICSILKEQLYDQIKA
jgi:hypothetical protein